MTRRFTIGAMLAVAASLLNGGGAEGRFLRRGPCRPQGWVCGPAYVVSTPFVVVTPYQPPTEPHQSGKGLRWPTKHWVWAGEICERTIALCEQLRVLSNHREYGSFVLPVKVQAGQALALVRGGSDEVRLGELMQALHARMAAADPYIDDMLERDAAFWHAIAFLVERYRIQAVLEGKW